MPLQEVHLAPEPLDRFGPLIGEERLREAQRAAQRLREGAGERAIWNVNSTVVGGGVAEMLRTLLPYARGLGVDARWVVIKGSPDFFRVTKRLHNALHGERGDGLPLDEAARAIYETTLRANAEELLALVRPRDVVILHDPQTAGLAPALLRVGARVIWRCHIGTEEENAETELGWDFLWPYLRDLHAFVFSRAAYIPRRLPRARCAIIQPSIDPFSPKNQDLDPHTVRAILAQTGLIEGPPGQAPIFVREDGTPGRVDRAADVIRLGRAPAWETPLVVQVSRWDALKDPLGVLHGFARLVEEGGNAGAQLLLAGPNVNAVADDPDGARVFEDVTTAWRRLPHYTRHMVHLANLPTADVEENAAIVNAVQRHATVVVQKSLREGFGLTVTEAMWKARPVVASAVGGIVDQIEDGIDGLLVHNPRDLGEFAATLRRVLDDPEFASRLGQRARARATERFLSVRHLLQYAALISRLDAEAAARAGAADAIPAAGAD